MAVEVALGWKPGYKPTVITFPLFALLIGYIPWSFFPLPCPPGLKIRPRIKEKKILLTKPIGKKEEERD